MRGRISRRVAGVLGEEGDCILAHGSLKRGGLC
jgi:hypothetical protein